MGIGYYEVFESALPTGYVLTDGGRFYIKVGADGVQLLQKDVTKAPKDWEIIDSGGMVYEVTAATGSNPTTMTVDNEPGAALPHTGGSGTALIYLFGALLTLGGALTLVARRRAAIRK